MRASNDSFYFWVNYLLKTRSVSLKHHFYHQYLSTSLIEMEYNVIGAFCPFCLCLSSLKQDVPSPVQPSLICKGQISNASVFSYCFLVCFPSALFSVSFVRLSEVCIRLLSPFVFIFVPFASLLACRKHA